MRKIIQQTQFKKDLKKISRSGCYQIDDLFSIIEKLIHDKPLDTKHNNHNLTGDWNDYSECHIKPDWLLIYKLEPEKVILVRTGSHSELF
ncbi:MAG: type II toxin-antitoxin system YafQ family toxin [Desulfobacterales bacterium]|nr:type II toxin-antitoxin system YafQ family toxin [Desulfobacterales bacterium]